MSLSPKYIAVGSVCAFSHVRFGSKGKYRSLSNFYHLLRPLLDIFNLRLAVVSSQKLSSTSLYVESS